MFDYAVLLFYANDDGLMVFLDGMQGHRLPMAFQDRA